MRLSEKSGQQAGSNSAAYIQAIPTLSANPENDLSAKVGIKSLDLINNNNLTNSIRENENFSYLDLAENIQAPNQSQTQSANQSLKLVPNYQNAAANEPLNRPFKFNLKDYDFIFNEKWIKALLARAGKTDLLDIALNPQCQTDFILQFCNDENDCRTKAHWQTTYAYNHVKIWQKRQRIIAAPNIKEKRIFELKQQLLTQKIADLEAKAAYENSKFVLNTDFIAGKDNQQAWLDLLAFNQLQASDLTPEIMAKVYLLLDK